MSEILDQLIENNSPLIVSCINAPISDVENDIIGIVNVSFGAKWIKTYEVINQEQIENILSVPNLRSIVFLLWTPQLGPGKFTVFINNFEDGWITLMNKYSANFNKEIAVATFSNESGTFPKYKFCYRNGLVERNVHLLKDGRKWQFYAMGDPLPFEELAVYDQKMISSKLSNGIVEKYMKALGFDCRKPEFWLSAGEAIKFTRVFP